MYSISSVVVGRKTKMFKFEERHQTVLSEQVKFALVLKGHRHRLSFDKQKMRKVKNTQSVKFLFQIVFYSDQYNGIMKWKEITIVKYGLTINKTSKFFL